MTSALESKCDNITIRFYDKNLSMMVEAVFVLALAVTIVAAVLSVIPRCPECGCSMTSPNSVDPSLRHCRRCLAIFEPGGRR